MKKSLLASLLALAPSLALAQNLPSPAFKTATFANLPTFTGCTGFVFGNNASPASCATSTGSGSVVLANSPTLSGTLTVSGSGAEQLNLTQTSGGSTFQLASNGGVANLSNYYSGGNMTFGIQSGGVYGWYVNGAAVGTLGATGLSVSNTIQSTSGGFKFPDSTVQTTAAVTVTTFDAEVVVNSATAAEDDPAGAGDGFPNASVAMTP